jgi:hypothetical protein
MSKIKVNTIAPRSGSTVTLGEAGNTIALGACASQTGFGRTGTVDWCTTAKTSPLTAVSGKGYFINTCGGTVTVTLPSSPSAGDIVSLKDYKDTWDNNKVIVGRNSSKIFGLCLDANLNTEGQVVSLIYVDGTQGWMNVQTDTTVKGNAYITATGGNAVVTCGNFKTHIFTGAGTFCVSAAANSAPDNVVEYLVVAGGGSGGASGPSTGGGGAGGFRYFSALSPAGSPLVAPAGVTVSASPYSITVGGGAPKGSDPPGTGGSGSTSTFSSISSAGGGGGGYYPNGAGVAGGSGGGGGNVNSTPTSGGAGNTPPVSPAQGTDGGDGAQLQPGPSPNHRQGGGGGGAGAAGGDVTPSSSGGAGGTGSYIPDGFIGPTAPSYGTPGPVSSVRYFAGGGGGGGYTAPSSTTGGGAAGAGGGSAGAAGPGNDSNNGTANTGGGSGGNYGGGDNCATGGSGIVMIRYRYQ